MEVSSIGDFSIAAQLGAMSTFTPDLSKMSPDRVAKRLEIVRETIGLGPSEFADSVGIDRSSYSKIEAGRKVLKADMAFAISERWGIPMEFLYKGSLQDLPDKFASSIIDSLNNG